MDEITPSPADAPSGAPEPHAGARRVKRRLMFSLVGLYAASIMAASIIIARNEAPSAPSGKTKGRPAASLLGPTSEFAVGWIPIRGVIANSSSGKPWERGVEQWVHRLRSMAEDKDVKAIVLDINSPGGSVGAVQELHSQIERVRRERHIPVVALFDDVSASGGYYIATACDRIVAHPGTLTGSIGVIFDFVDAQGLLKKIGVAFAPVKSGKLKDIGSPARPMTPEERKVLQGVINDAYGQFLAAVSQGRNIPLATLKPLADGRIYSGDQALRLHLVDELGDSEDALALAAKLGGIQGRPKVKRETENLSQLFDLISSRFDGGLLGAQAGALVDRLAPPRAGLEYLWPGWSR